MKSVGIRKRTWFKTAGVVAVAAQFLGGGIASAAGKTCFPAPAFATGGDPPLGQLDQASVLRWTNSSGYSWSAGSAPEFTYDVVMATNPEYPVSGHPEYKAKRLMLQFQRDMQTPSLYNFEGARFGFNYDGVDKGTAEKVSQVIVVNFSAPGTHTTFSATPADCAKAGGASATWCANNVSQTNNNADPTKWMYVDPKLMSFTLEQKVESNPSTPWPGTNDVTWLQQYVRLWLFVDRTDFNSDPMHDPAKLHYWWRMQLAMPIRGKAPKMGTTTPLVAPDPTAAWLEPGVYLDDNVFNSAGKTTTPYWIDMIGAGLMGNAVVKFFPDTTSLDTSRDMGGVPLYTEFATSEMGSPRAAVVGDPLTCTGNGLQIEEGPSDPSNPKAVWHSSIWNKIDVAQDTDPYAFGAGGKLHFFDNSGNPLANQFAVKIMNNGPAVTGSNVKATFSIAPYGSQTPDTIWAPLNTARNDFTCGPGSSLHVCVKPTPVQAAPIDSSSSAGTVNSGTDFEVDSVPWTAANNYACAVQTNDAATDWFWSDQTAACAGSSWHPDGSTNDATTLGLPGHQCIQAKLTAVNQNVQFDTASAFRNMHQVPASLHRETATIDTRGLKKIAGQGYHYVYLYVETRNMPYRVDTGYAPTNYQNAVSDYWEYNDCNPSPIEGRGCTRGFDPSVPAPSDSFFMQTMPTFVVHTYADTGRSYVQNGQKVPMLQELTSFGQYVSHDAATEGPVYGWDASLEPVAGTDFKKLAYNTWRIKVPNDGAGQVVTHVEALPTKRPTCSGTVNMDVVQLLQAIAPLVKLSAEDAGEINAFIDSFQIECVDLAWWLNKVAGGSWGIWTSWVKYLVNETLTASGCHCQ